MEKYVVTLEIMSADSAALEQYIGECIDAAPTKDHAITVATIESPDGVITDMLDLDDPEDDDTDDDDTDEDKSDSPEHTNLEN